MIRVLLIGTTFVSVVLFPWPLTVFLVFASSVFEPLIPLIVGIFADTLYYAPQVYAVPLYTLYGMILTGTVFFVRSRLRASTMRE